jgi:hypothetical protein
MFPTRPRTPGFAIGNEDVPGQWPAG